jgi:hypothetical protein
MRILCGLPLPPPPLPPKPPARTPLPVRHAVMYLDAPYICRGVQVREGCVHTRTLLPERHAACDLARRDGEGEGRGEGVYPSM